MRPVMDLKNDFDVIASLGDIVDVLKTATLIQFRTFHARATPLTDFSKEAEEIFSHLRLRLEEDKGRHPFFYRRNDLPSLIVIVSSEEGFLGEINTLLINAALDQRKRQDDEILVIGERGARYLEDLKLKFTFFPGLTDEISAIEVQRVSDFLLGAYRKRVGRVLVVYPAFLSLMVQKITIWKGLPYLQKGEVLSSLGSSDLKKDILVEPSAARALEGAVDLWFNSKLTQIFWSSKLAEYAARIMHLEGSGQELSQRRKDLSTEYFRQVHTLRDKVIREITSSRQIAGVR